VFELVNLGEEHLFSEFKFFLYKTNCVDEKKF